MSSYKDHRKDAQRAERTVPICLRGDLVADWEAAEFELRRAQDQRLGADSKEDAGLGALADRVQALEAEMREHMENWRLRALPRFKFRALVAAHPPRKGEDGEVLDEDQLGLNRDTFFPALIRACLVHPHLDDDDWVWLLGSEDENGEDEDGEEGILSDRQVSDLQDAAWFLNRGEVAVPFSRAASFVRRSTEAE